MSLIMPDGRNVARAVVDVSATASSWASSIRAAIITMPRSSR